MSEFDKLWGIGTVIAGVIGGMGEGGRSSWDGKDPESMRFFVAVASKEDLVVVVDDAFCLCE